MNRLGNSNINKILLTLIVLSSCIGCVTVKEMPVTSGLTKEEITQAWRREPDKVYYNPKKYNADELWIYKYPGGSQEDRFYFRQDILIKEEHVTYDVL